MLPTYFCDFEYTGNSFVEKNISAADGDYILSCWKEYTSIFVNSVKSSEN